MKSLRYTVRLLASLAIETAEIAIKSFGNIKFIKNIHYISIPVLLFKFHSLLPNANLVKLRPLCCLITYRNQYRKS